MKTFRPVQKTNGDSSPSSSDDSRHQFTTKIDYFKLSALIVFSIHSLSMRFTRKLFTVYGAIVLLLLLGIPVAAPQRTHKLFWDDKNPVFNRGNNKMFVEEGDDITIICPYNSPEHNNIYWSKTRDAYDLCDHTSDQNSIKLITCEPYSTKEFNFQVTRFSWVSLNPNFLPGKPIYLMFESSGLKCFLKRFGHCYLSSYQGEILINAQIFQLTYFANALRLNGSRRSWFSTTTKTQSNFCNKYNMRIAIILKSLDNKGKLKEVAAPERVIQPNNSSSILLMWSPIIVVSIALFSPWS